MSVFVVKNEGFGEKTGREDGLFGGMKLRIRLFIAVPSVNGLILDPKV